MNEFIDACLDPFAFVEGTFLFGPPDVVSLDVVDLFGDVHPFVLGLRCRLLGVELADEAGVGGDTGG